MLQIYIMKRSHDVQMMSLKDDPGTMEESRQTKRLFDNILVFWQETRNLKEGSIEDQTLNPQKIKAARVKENMKLLIPTNE